ncbi:hypothetical protein Lal_00034437 [Lupinus albus]|nr:hypothetical protein Lal_00034437 [Lupinus albus]
MLEISEAYQGKMGRQGGWGAWLGKDRVPTKTALSRQRVSFHNGGGLLYSLCNVDLESATHLFSYGKVTYYDITVALPQIHIHHYFNHLDMVTEKRVGKCGASSGLLQYGLFGDIRMT